ncbi:extensin family protein [Aurantiacibacter gangjinensis]|uniref:Uncharacterized protein n=1 Tax=Aurantiacibacter gangjinensis TaxID=502682 RepID=A0A0G9MRX8_9SPHN|nr:extensin family protein [Aurantiacibacter gangjinensis]APE28169.1 extensin-like protein [Aurantiacibacter gangjinensis]KLE32078.1 hypothetical protein AAW01_11725 [Aurantiacibacter gangjinensis]
MNRMLLISLGAPLFSLALTGCQLVPQASGPRYSASASADIPARATSRPVARPTAQRLPAPRPALATAGGQCMAQLDQAGVTFDAVANQDFGSGCSTLGTVQMHALSSDNGMLGVANLGPVTCPVSAAFAAWARFGVDRAAQQIFGQGVASIETMGSYACRNVAGSNRRSGHASANAIDVAGFVLEDGTRITVTDGWNGNARERQFLRTVQRSACRRFGTVLGPEYNAAHEDHFHLEGVIDGTSYCR